MEGLCIVTDVITWAVLCEWILRHSAPITFSYFSDPLVQSYTECETERVEMAAPPGSALATALRYFPFCQVSF